MQPPLATDELPTRINPAEMAASSSMQITSEIEIRSLLTQACANDELVSIYFDPSDSFYLSSIQSVSISGLVFASADGDLPKLTSDSSSLLCVCWQSKVKLQFEVVGKGVTHDKGLSVLETHLPKSVIRLQRRDFYRLAVPASAALSAYIPNGDDEIEISLVDISLGGIGILGYAPGIRLASGKKLHGVRIELADAGTVIADVEICSRNDVVLRNGIQTFRTGARFINLPGTTQAIIQRFITRVDRERTAAQLRPTGNAQ